MSTQEPVDYGERIRLTADAVESLLYYYARPEPFVYSLVDHLLLLYFAEVCLRITVGPPSRAASQTVVQTIASDDLEYRGINLSDPKLSVHSYTGLADRGILLTVTALHRTARFPGGNLIAQLFEELGAKRRTTRHTAEQLIEEFCRDHSGRSFQTPAPAAISPERVDAYLGRFQAGYFDGLVGELTNPSSALSLLGMDAKVRLPKGVVPLNLFPVVRYRPSTDYRRTARSPSGAMTFDYTARLLWSQSQFDWAQACLGGKTGEAERMLKAPLGDNSRWIGDTAFLSGSLVSGADLETARQGEGASDTAGSEADTRRHRMETALYARLGSQLKIVYFPTHVGGTPWLALYSFAAPDSWRHYLHLYRQIIPFVGSRVREMAREAFFDCLLESLRQPVRDNASWSPELVAEINRAWLGTSLVFPFPAPQVVPVPTGVGPPDAADSCFEIGAARYMVVFPEDAAYFPLQVDFGQLARELRPRLAGRIKQELVTQYTGRVLQLHGVFNLGHELKNAIGETGWDSLLRDLEKRTPAELLAGDFIERARRGLGHMLWPASLIAMIATLGKAELQQNVAGELRKNYLEGTDEFQYGPEVLREYRDSVAYLVNYIAALSHAAERPFQVAEWTGPEPVEDAFRAGHFPPVGPGWRPGPPARSAMDLQRIRFSPISRRDTAGQSMRLAVASLLSEATRNAARALTDAPKDFTPRLLVWSVSPGEREITVRIANTFPGNASPDLMATSNRLVDAMGRMLGIGSVGVPTEVVSGSDSKLILTVVHLHPDRLGSGRIS